MPRDHNLYANMSGGDARNAFAAGKMYSNKTTLNRHSGASEDSGMISQNNVRNVLTVGLAFNSAQKLNEVVGAYTNNRLRQRKVDTGMTFAKYAIGIGINAPAGLTYLVSDLAYRGIQYGIKVGKINREAQYYQRLSGNTANSGSKYRGDYL